MIRNFTLTNALGASFSLMNAQQGAFFEPQGLGYDDVTQYEQVGEFFAPLTQRYGQQVVTGTMVFGSQPYEHYLAFTKFCQHAPLSLVYETDAGTFQIPCRLTKIEKGDTDGWTYLNCKVEFTALARMYKTVVANNTGTAGGGKIYSEKELPDITGSIITIDNAEAGEVLNITADIDPIQDLHGYDSPWVGGAGSNIWDEEWENGYYFVNNGQIAKGSSSTTIRSTNYIRVQPNTSYYCKGNIYRRFFFDSDKNYLSYGGGANTTFTTPNDCHYILFYCESTSTYGNDIAINYPSSVTTYSPYENICPISGHTEVDVVVSPTTDAEDGNTYTTSLGRTVYGGTLDLVSGVLTVDRAMVDLGTLTWSKVATSGSNYWFRASKSDIAIIPLGSAMPNMVCSHYETLIPNNAYTGNTGVSQTAQASYVVVCDMSYSDATAFTTAMSGVQLVYELATPQTYQLTPQQIQTLLGQNNVWANSGDITITGRKTYGYKYNYTYGDFVADTVTIDSDSTTSSPCRITIFGECTQPTWRHYLDGNSVATGYYNGTIPSGHKLVIDTTSSPYSIEEQDIAGNLIADRYELCDFSTERFFLLEYGRNTISVSHTDPDSIRLMVEGYIFYETV